MELYLLIAISCDLSLPFFRCYNWMFLYLLGCFWLILGIYIQLIEIMLLKENNSANDNRVMKEEHVTLTLTMKYSF